MSDNIFKATLEGSLKTIELKDLARKLPDDFDIAESGDIKFRNVKVAKDDFDIDMGGNIRFRNVDIRYLKLRDALDKANNLIDSLDKSSGVKELFGVVSTETEYFKNKVVDQLFITGTEISQETLEPLKNYTNATLKRLEAFSELDFKYAEIQKNGRNGDELSELVQGSTKDSHNIISGTPANYKEQVKSEIVNLAQDLGLEVNPAKAKEVGVGKLALASAENIPVIGDLIKSVRIGIEEKSITAGIKATFGSMMS